MGCAAPEKAASESANALNADRRTQSVRAAGLEIRQWVVSGDGMGGVADLLLRHRSGEPPESDAIERFHRNGFRLVRLAAEELDAIAEEMEGLRHDRSGWHGQMHEWRELHGLGLEVGGIAVAIDGRVRRFDRGSLRLMSRAWIVPMEDGPRLQLDLVAQHHAPDLRGQYRRLLGQRDSPDAVAHSVAASMMLEAGYAYVFVPESPAAPWDRGGDDDARPIGPRRSGPEVEMPRTIGEVLLTGHGTATSRGMLIFVPHIPQELFPDEVRSASELNAAAQGPRRPSR